MHWGAVLACRGAGLLDGQVVGLPHRVASVGNERQICLKQRVEVRLLVAAPGFDGVNCLGEGDGPTIPTLDQLRKELGKSSVLLTQGKFTKASRYA